MDISYLNLRKRNLEIMRGWLRGAVNYAWEACCPGNAHDNASSVFQRYTFLLTNLSAAEMETTTMFKKIEI